VLEEQGSAVSAHSPPTGTCVTVPLFLSCYEIEQAVNQAVEVMATGLPMLMDTLGEDLILTKAMV